MIAEKVRRWRALRPRSRAVYVLLGMTPLLLSIGFVFRDGGNTWPARAVLKTSGCASPLAFSPDGRTLLTSGRGGITLWEVSSGRRLEAWEFPWGETAYMGTFSPDGKTFAVVTHRLSDRISIGLFDMATGKKKGTLNTSCEMIIQLRFAEDGRTLLAILGNDPQINGISAWNEACGGDLNEEATWDTTTGRQISRKSLAPPTRRAITAVSPKGDILAFSDRLRAVQLWDLDTDSSLGVLINPTTTSPVIGAGLGFSDDGRTLAVGRVDGIIELWDVKNRKLLKMLRGQTDEFTFTKFQFSPGGRTLALTGYRRRPDSTLTMIREKVERLLGSTPKPASELLLLEIATGRRLAGAAGSTRPFYSPDGSVLATDEPDGSTRLRDIPAQ